MKGFNFRKFVFLIFISFAFAFAFFVLGQNDGNNPPSALNYAPNFQFDPDEQYYPVNPLDFYFENGEEIEGARARAKYDILSDKEKKDNFVIFYHIEDEGDHWVYQYWIFCVFNDSQGVVKNEHYGDWEAVFVFVDKETKGVIRAVGTAHERKVFDTEIESPKTNHIWAYVADGSHAICVDEENDKKCNFWKWNYLDKWDQDGYVSLFSQHKLKEITHKYISQFNNKTSFTKSPTIEMNLLKIFGIQNDNKESIFNTEKGGETPLFAWHQSEYQNPSEARPRNAGYAMEIVGNEIKKASDGIVNFWDELFGGENGLTFQPAGIGGTLVGNPATEVEEDLVVPVLVEKVVAPVVDVIPPAPNKKEPVIVKEKTVVIVEEKKTAGKEVGEETESELAVPSPYPFGFSFSIGGGAASEPEPTAAPAPATTSSPVSVPAPVITSHFSGDILGFNQINLAGTSLPDFLVSVSLASTTAATTTADNSGNWDCTLDLSEGENDLTVKAIDDNNNESEEVLLNLIVDTTPPSVVSDLSATSGVSRGTIALSWTAPGDSVSVSEYIIRYSTSSEITALNWASSTDIDGEPSPSSASSTENLIISNLTPSERYYWALKSADNLGNLSEISNCASSSPSAIAENIVISEISVQLGDSRKTDEFIELYNPTNNPINLSGWSIKYASALSTTTWEYKYFDIDGKANKFLPNFNLPSHSYYLLTSATSSDPSYNYYSYNTEPDLTAVTSAGVPYHLGLSAAGGKIKLLNSNEETVDLVAWGKDSLGAEGEPVDIGGFPWGSLERQAFASSTAELLAVNGAHHWSGNSIDRDDNSQDFVLQTAPNPQNSLSLVEPDAVFPELANTAWPMFQHDVRHTGLSPYTGTATGTPTSTPKWVVNLGSGSPSSPVVGLSGEIYIGAASGNLYKINAADGAKELFYNAPFGGTIQTPAIASDGTIYISDNHHYLYALSAEGQLKWKYNILDGSSPTIGSDGTIYVGSSDGLHAINPNGERIWYNSQLSNGRWVKASVLDSDGTIYTVGRTGSDDGNRNVYALNPQDGSITWRSASSTFSTALSLDGNGTIFAGGIYGLYALNTSDGSQKWLASVGKISNSIPAIGSDGTVYVGSNDYNLHALNKTDGNAKWTFNAQGEIHASPIIDADGVIYIGSNSKTFYAVNPTDGSLKWQSEELNGVISQGAAIDSDGIIYIASDDGTLYAFGD